MTREAEYGTEVKEEHDNGHNDKGVEVERRPRPSRRGRIEDFGVCDMIERERFQVVSWMRAKRGVLLNEGDGDMMCLPVIEGPSRPQEHRLVTYIRSTDSAGIMIFARIEYTSNVGGGRVQIQLVGVDGFA